MSLTIDVEVHYPMHNYFDYFDMEYDDSTTMTDQDHDAHLIPVSLDTMKSY